MKQIQQLEMRKIIESAQTPLRIIKRAVQLVSTEKRRTFQLQLQQ